MMRGKREATEGEGRGRVSNLWYHFAAGGGSFPLGALSQGFSKNGARRSKRRNPLCVDKPHISTFPPHASFSFE